MGHYAKVNKSGKVLGGYSGADVELQPHANDEFFVEVNRMVQFGDVEVNLDTHELVHVEPDNGLPMTLSDEFLTDIREAVVRPFPQGS